MKRLGAGVICMSQSLSVLQFVCVRERMCMCVHRNAFAMGRLLSLAGYFLDIQIV